MRIMKSYGFTIKAMWYSETDGKTEFVYILEWPDIAMLQKQWAAFMEDDEWEEIKRKSREEHGEMVLLKVKDQILVPTTWFRNSTAEAAGSD